MAYPDVLTQNFTIIGEILGVISIIMGLGLLFAGIFQFKKYGEMRTMMSAQMSMSGPLMLLLSAGILLALPFFLNTFLIALTGYDTPMPYGGDNTSYGALIPPILMLVRIVGIGSFIRGVVLLSRSGDHHRAQPGMVSKAMIHMLAGVMCIHIQGTLDLFRNVLGL